MIPYILKRIGYGLVVLFGLTILSFTLIHLVPGDPARVMLGANPTQEQVEDLRQEMGLNQPLLVQYKDYMKGLLQLDLGESYKSERPVVTEILLRFPATFKLATLGLLISIVIGITMGILAAKFKDSIIDFATMSFAILGVSIPNFWLGLMLMLLFTVKLKWLPIAGGTGINDVILPAITLGVMGSAVISRMTRSGMLEVLQSDFIRTARSKGLPEKTVLFSHAFKNALIPVVTIVGLQLATLLGGTVIVEKVFNWPGIGSLAIESILYRDYPMVQGITLFFGVVFIIINLTVDILYSVIDPRIKV